MQVIFYVFTRFVFALVSFLELAMLVRAIMSWIPSLEETKLYDFVYALTEPFIYPVRQLLEKLNWFQGMPIDMSFLFTVILLSIISSLLTLGF